jgi:hypothetical protein
MMGVGGHRPWLRVAGLAVLLAVTAAVATERADKQRIGTDFHVF